MPQTTTPLDALLTSIAERSDADGSVGEFLAQQLAEQNLSREDVVALQHDAFARFTEIREAGRLSDDDLALMDRLADISEAASTEVGRQDAAVAERNARIDDLAGRMTPIAEPAAGEGDGAGDGEPAAPAGDPELAGDPAPAGDVTPAPAAAPAAAPAPVANAASVVRRMAAQAPQPAPATASRSNKILASDDVRGVKSGSELATLEQLTAAAVAKFESLPPNGTLPEGSRQGGNVAQIRAQYPDELVASGKNDHDVVEYAASTDRLEGGSLVAAGGWCTPSEPIYDLLPSLADATTGLVDMPTIGIERGGIRTAPTPTYADLASASVGNIQTEAQAIAGTVKSFYRVPCPPEWPETRADVIYTGIESGILQDNSFPEQKRAHVELALTVHAAKLNRSSIARAVAKAIPVSAAALGPSAVNAVLNAVDLLLTEARYQYRAQPGMIFEVWLPLWARLILRADYGLRAGIQLENVTDAMVDGWFTEKGARLQYLYDWQDAYSGVAGGFGRALAANAALAFPTTIDIEVHPAGTFVRGRGTLVNIEAVYDSTNLKSNDCLALFFEEKLLVHQRAYKAYKLTVPVSIMGATGIAVKVDGNGKIATA